MSESINPRCVSACGDYNCSGCRFDTDKVYELEGKNNDLQYEIQSLREELERAEHTIVDMRRQSESGRCDSATCYANHRAIVAWENNYFTDKESQRGKEAGK